VTPDYIAATRASYDAVADAYAAQFSDELRAKPLDRALLTAFAERLRLAGPGQQQASGSGQPRPDNTAPDGTGPGGTGQPRPDNTVPDGTGPGGSGQPRPAGTGRPRAWDIGCGPGHVTAFLAGLGLDAAGIDLSDRMVAQARARHPDLEFSAGSMTALPAPDGSWDGLVSFYSLIHMIDDADVRTALAEFRRVLADGGLLLLAVHAGEEVRHSAEWFGTPVDVSFRFFDPAWLAAELDRAGFAVEALTRRQPYPDAEVATERAYFLARVR
jgi:SAM-dependent methyltransferase